MERVTYRPTLLQGSVMFGAFTCAVVLPQLIGPATWDRSFLTVLAVSLLLLFLLVFRQGLRIDDRGITVLRGPFQRRVPWDEVVAVEESYSGLGRRFLVVITTRTVHPVTFPMDGRLLRDDAFGRKTRHVQDLVARELQRRAPAGVPQP